MQAGLQARSRVDIEFQPRCVRACVCARVSTRVSACESWGGGRARSLSKPRPSGSRAERATEPRRAGALKPFMILVTLF